MSLLNPTPEELQARRAAQLAELDQRAGHWRQRRKCFVRNLALAGAVVFTLTCRVAAAGGGGMSWEMWLLTPIVGAALAALIAHAEWGMLRGMAVYGLGCFAAWFPGYLAGWWMLAEAGGLMMYGPLLLMVCAWLSWVIAGAVFGWLSDTFASDTQQV